MTTHTTGAIHIFARALEPLHHGQGAEGNMQVLRRQEVPQPDGTIARVPYISGNSIRHMIRECGVRFALDAMGIEDGALSKSVVDLLFSGGNLGGKTPPTLARARRIAELFPIIAALGYSAGSRIQPGKLDVGALHLVCAENGWRIDTQALATHDCMPMLGMRAGAFVSDDFGTRHDAARSLAGQRYLAIEDRAKADASGEAKKGRVKEDKPDDSTQMIYSYETISPGAAFYGSIIYRDLTDRELDALRSALSYACSGRAPDGGYLFTVGAKRGTGLGKMSWHFDGAIRHVTAPTSTPSDAMLPVVSTAEPSAALAVYAERLREHRDEIVTLLRELSE